MRIPPLSVNGQAALPPTVRPPMRIVGRPTPTGTHWPFLPQLPMPGSSAIGNDMALDPGMGNCGKNGQWVPVGVGQPTILIGGLTVGGSAA